MIDTVKNATSKENQAKWEKKKKKNREREKKKRIRRRKEKKCSWHTCKPKPPRLSTIAAISSYSSASWPSISLTQTHKRRSNPLSDRVGHKVSLLFGYWCSDSDFWFPFPPLPRLMSAHPLFFCFLFLLFCLISPLFLCIFLLFCFLFPFVYLTHLLSFMFFLISLLSDLSVIIHFLSISLCFILLICYSFRSYIPLLYLIHMFSFILLLYTLVLFYSFVCLLVTYGWSCLLEIPLWRCFLYSLLLFFLPVFPLYFSFSIFYLVIFSIFITPSRG